eukprot:m.261759 g.261759  ORF g.261759 m.261759 type:complete len:1893 (-) comp22753_c0_seq1:42-5720(-)
MEIDAAKLQKVPSEQRQLLMLRWLAETEPTVVPENKEKLKAAAGQLADQLLSILVLEPGAVVTKHTASCITALISVVGGNVLAESMRRCVVACKAKEEATNASIASKIAALECMGEIAKAQGRMLAPFVPEVLPAVLKLCRANEARVRHAALETLVHLVNGLGESLSSSFRDIYKALRSGLGDRVVAVRAAAVRAAAAFVAQSDYVVQNEYDGSVQALVKALEGSDSDLRRAAASFLGVLLALSQDQSRWGPKQKRPTLEETCGVLVTAFARAESRECRVGLTYAFVSLFSQLGAVWTEKNIAVVVKEVTALLSHTKASTSPTDAQCARKSVTYVLVTVLGKYLGQQGRINSVLELSQQVGRLMEAFAADTSGAADKESHAHTLVACLDAMAELIPLVGSPILTSFETVATQLQSVFLHSSRHARLYAAHCLRALASTLRSRASVLANQCLERVDKYRSSPEGIHGAVYALAAVLGGSASCKLGLPHSLSANVLAAAEGLLLSHKAVAVSNVTLALNMLEGGWVLIGALCGLGSAAVSPYVARCVAAWTAVFPEEKGRVAVPKDANGWRLLLQDQVGCLTAMYTFLCDCQGLVTVDAQRLIVRCANEAVNWLSDVPTSGRNTQQLQHVKLQLRARLYTIYLQLPQNMYEKFFPSLLPHLVSDFTLSDTASNVSITSLLPQYCRDTDPVIWGHSQDTDQAVMEAQLAVHGTCGLASPTHDTTLLFRPDRGSPLIHAGLPPEVAIVDAAILLFTAIFPALSSQKHRYQLLEHFVSCCKAAKSGPRRQAVHTNVFTAFLGALHGITERKGELGRDKVVGIAQTLVLSTITNADNTLRAAAAEALGVLGQAAGSAFVNEAFQLCMNQLKNDRDATSRSGFSLALGSLHRHVSPSDSSRNVAGSVSMLQALAADTAVLVQTWALHALALTVEAAGFEFSPYVAACTDRIVNVLLSVPLLDTSVHICAGNVLCALITTVGPELQVHDAVRDSVVMMSFELLAFPDASAQLSAIRSLQQLVIFTPKHVDIPRFLPVLESGLSSPHLTLRQASSASLRQLLQRNPADVRAVCQGIEERLFKILDKEEHEKLQKELQDCIVFLLTELGGAEPSHWLRLCNNVLSGATERQEQEEAQDDLDLGKAEEENEDEEADDAARGQALNTTAATRVVIPTRWQSKVFAVSCVQQVIDVCCKLAQQQSPSASTHAHFDLQAARAAKGDFLVDKLAELIRTAFMSATSAIDQLRQVGLELLEHIISHFAASTDPDVDGNRSLLEQYQAQVTSALRPAFASDTPPDVTTIACRVCASWIASGVNKNVSDLKRLSSLLVTRLEVVNMSADPAYHERASTMLRLGLLNSWAYIYVSYMDKAGFEYLEEIVEPHVEQLRTCWTHALRDYALITLPPEYSSQIPETGNFYSTGSRSSVRVYYEGAFQQLVHATGLIADLSDDADSDNFFLLLGVCTRALCSRVDEGTTCACLKAIKRLIGASSRLRKDKVLCIELFDVMHHTLRTQGASAKQCVLEAVLESVTSDQGIEDQDDIVPGNSTVYSVLEICTSTLLRELPQLNPAYSATLPVSNLSAESAVLLCTALDALSHLPQCCKPQNSLLLLPSILVLLVGVLRQGESAISDAALKSLQRVLNYEHRHEEQIASSWTGLVCSSLLSILQDVSGNPPPEKLASMLGALALYAAAVPQSMESEPTRSLVIGVLKHCMHEAMPALTRQKAIAAAANMIQSASTTSSEPVRATGQALVHHTLPEVLPVLSHATRTPPATEEDLRTVAETLRYLEVAADLAEADHVAIYLGMVLPLLVALLRTPAPSAASRAPADRLHHAALALLNRTGPRYTAAFKSVVLSVPQLKQRLEAALRAGSSQQGAQGRSSAAGPSKPTIELKMDFSGFKA